VIALTRIRLAKTLRAVGASGLLGVVLLALTPTGCYVSRAAFEEARILARRQPIDQLVRDSGTPVRERDKLALVQAARQFARDSLGLTPGESFTRYTRMNRDTLVLVLSAAYRDRLERRTWWFPVVGRFPYKGFFDFDAAHRTASDMRREGFDVVLGASSAFSTLGWFNDPLLSTTLRLDSVQLVNTVLHEITHTTLFVKNDVVFNESFASYVGGRGAIAFFRARGDSALLRRAERAWEDAKTLGAFWERLHARLDSAFTANRGADSVARERRLGARQQIFADARRELVEQVAPQLAYGTRAWAEQLPLDNAVVMARRVYSTGLHRFDELGVVESVRQYRNR
jgi:predicted aminopeptidase